MRLRRNFLLCFGAIVIFSANAVAQNLVMNPSFETYSSCPVGPSELNKAANWVDPYISIVGDTCSTSDLYNACNTLGSMGVDVPANILGTEPARTGNGYAGIIIYEGMALMPNDCNSAGGSGWREYLEGELTTPLTAGQQYCVSFWVSLADNVKWASNNFAVHFSNSLIAINCSTVGSNSDLGSYGVTPQLTYAGSPILTTNGWTKLEWTYLATGGEKFITIGNFNGNSGTNYVCSNASVMNPYAYYYVEDVSVVPNACTTVNLTVCKETNGDLTVSGGTGPYTWAQWMPASSTPITNQTECQACGYSWTFGTCLNGMTPATTCNTPAGYVNFGTGTTVTPPGGATQIKVTDGGGNFYEITDLSTVPNCSASCDATINPAGPFCANASAVNLTAVSPGGTWSGTGITNATNGTFNPTTAGVGSHVITYTISGSCGSTDTVTIVVNPSEDASFSYPSGSYCLTDANPTPTITGTSGGTFTINNSGVINATTGVINISSSGTGSYVVTYITPGACKDTSTFTLNINNCSSPLPVSNFAASQTTICVGACISYTDMSSSSAVGGITTWSWTFTGGTPSTSTTQSPTSVCYNTAGTYEVSLTVTDTNGTDTETKTAYITVNACTTPTASFTISDTTLCAGECVTFTNTSTGATTWQWTFQNGTPPTSSNQNPGSVCFNTAGTQNIKLVVSNPYGSDSVTHTINVVQPQQVVIGNDTTIQLGETVNLSATGVANGTYVWSPTTDLSCSVCPSPTSTPQETITYTVITSDTNGCTSTDNITIIVEFDNVIFVPNIFSPNNDGANDILYVRGKGVQKLRFFIYDRWGEKVFETSDLNVGWDGTFRGEDMNKAVFVYYLEATFIDGKEVTQKGDITLVK